MLVVPSKKNVATWKDRSEKKSVAAWKDQMRYIDIKNNKIIDRIRVSNEWNPYPIQIRKIHFF